MQSLNTVIKKYSNRRLYNTGTSCYITLEDLRNMVKRGEAFEVRDAKTNDDLTRNVLTQIIFEQELKGYNILPISFLRNLISLYDTSNQNYVSPYLELMMDYFVSNQEKIQSISHTQWDKLFPFSFIEHATRANMDLFEKTFGAFGKFK